MIRISSQWLSSILLSTCLLLQLGCSRQVDSTKVYEEDSNNKAKKDVNVQIGNVRVLVSNGTLHCSYDVWNRWKRNIYVNTYIWTIQSGLESHYRILYPSNTGNLLTLFNNEPKGYNVEYMTPSCPSISPQLSLVMPNDSLHIVFQMPINVDSLLWMKECNSVQIEVPVWTDMSSILPYGIGMTEMDTVRVSAHQACGIDRHDLLYAASRDRVPIMESESDSAFAQLQRCVIGQYYYQEKGTFRARVIR